jgi:hypothetical protein
MAKEGGSWQLAIGKLERLAGASLSRGRQDGRAFGGERVVDSRGAAWCPSDLLAAMRPTGQRAREHNTNTVASVGFGEKVFFLGLYLGSPSDATLLDAGNFRGVTEVTCASEYSVWDWIQQAWCQLKPWKRMLQVHRVAGYSASRLAEGAKEICSSSSARQVEK